MNSPKQELKTIPFARVSETVTKAPPLLNTLYNRQPFHNRNLSLNYNSGPRLPSGSFAPFTFQEEEAEQDTLTVRSGLSSRYSDGGKRGLNQKYKTMQEAVCQLAAELDTSRARPTRPDRKAAKHLIGGSDAKRDCTPLSKRARGSNLGNDFTPLRDSNYRHMVTTQNLEGFRQNDGNVESAGKFVSTPSSYAHTSVGENWYPQPSSDVRSPSSSPLRTQNHELHDFLHRRPVHTSFPTKSELGKGNIGSSNRPDDTPSRFYPSPNSPLKVNTMQVPRPPLPQLYLKGMGMNDTSDNRQVAQTLPEAANNIFTRQLKTASDVFCKKSSYAGSSSVAAFIADKETLRPCTADNSNPEQPLSYHGTVGAPKLASFPVTPHRDAPNVLNLELSDDDTIEDMELCESLQENGAEDCGLNGPGNPMLTARSRGYCAVGKDLTAGGIRNRDDMMETDEDERVYQELMEMGL